MSDELEELKRRLVVGHKSDGRSVYDEAAKSELVALCRQPGVSVSRLARECGVNANQVSRWLREHGHGGRARKAVASVMPAPAAFVAVSVPPASPIGARGRDDIVDVMDVQARLPNGVVIDLRGVRPAQRRRSDRGAREAAVFRFDEGLKVYLHREPIDFRLSINGLALLVEQALGLDPFAACAYVFSNRRRDRVKILGWERNGFWLLLKRLEKDRFIWPDAAAVPTLTVEQLHWLLEGIDIAVVRKHPRASTSAWPERTGGLHGTIAWGNAMIAERLRVMSIEAGDGSHAHRRRIRSAAAGPGRGDSAQRILVGELRVVTTERDLRTGAAERVAAPALRRQERGPRHRPEGPVPQRGRGARAHRADAAGRDR